MQTKEDEYAFNKRRNRTELYMIIWFMIILIYYFVDIAVNYVYFYYISNNEKNGKNTPSDDHSQHMQNDTTWFMKATYYFVGIQFLILTVLIIWQTYALILIIRVMGQRLSREQTRLKRLMVVFAVSYVGSSTYYICQVATDLHCTRATSCIRFNDFVVRAGVQILFDIVPYAVLYYQHF